MRLIDAEPMVRNLTAMKSMFDAIALDGMIKALNEAPTVDAVSVVRCKDCAWYRDDGSICLNPHCGKSFYGCRVREVHYCSYGERRAETI